MEVHEKISILFKNGIHVYPVHTVNGWKIEVDINGKKKKYDKVVTEKQINSRKWEENPVGITIDYYVNKILEK